MCEMNKQTEGLVYLQRAVSSARLSRDRRALLACLRNRYARFTCVLLVQKYEY
jgi:hypothetical protein